MQTESWISKTFQNLCKARQLEKSPQGQVQVCPKPVLHCCKNINPLPVYIFLSRFVQGCHKDTSQVGTIEATEVLFLIGLGDGKSKFKALANLQTGKDISFLANGRGLLSVYLCDKGTSQLLLQY